MRNRLNWCVASWLTATLLLAGSVQATPLKLKPTPGVTTGGRTGSGQYDPSEPYTVNTPDDWIVNLDPVKPVYERTVSDSFNGALGQYKKDHPDWSFTYSNDELGDDSFIVTTYDAEQGRSASGPCPTCVGAEFQVQYNKNPDPNPFRDLHWIQTVCTNHPTNPNVHHDVSDVSCYIDDPFSQGQRSPYYDDGAAADNTGFYDFPVREYDAPHVWTGEVFLVTGPAADKPGKVTVWGGIIWGWENHGGNSVASPEPATSFFIGCALVVLSLIRRNRHLRAGRS